MKRLFNVIVDRLLGFHLGSGAIDANDIANAITKMVQGVTYAVVVLLVAVYVLGATIVDGATLTAWSAGVWIVITLVVWLGFTKVILVILGIEYSVPKALSLFRKERAKATDSTKGEGILALLGRFEGRLEDVGVEVVTDLRRGFGDITLLLLTPAMLAGWGWIIHLQENDAVVPLVVATAAGLLGWFLAPKTKRRWVAWLLSILVILAFTVYTTVNDPETPFHRWSNTVAEHWSSGEEEEFASQQTLFSPATLNSDCLVPVEVETRYPGNGVTEYLVGPLSMGCTTETFRPDRGGWDTWRIVPQDRGSWATIKFEAGGPPFSFVCKSPEQFFPDQWPDFGVVDGAGYLIVAVWDSEFTQRPEYPCGGES